MKLLLTSAGITNDSIKKALFDLVGKAPADTSLAFVPTAANFEPGPKDWVEEDLERLSGLGLKKIEIVDIGIEPAEVWRRNFEGADILYFEGGDNFFLMEAINHSGLASVLPELLKDKVYVGASAGSMVLCKKLMLKACQELYEENLNRETDMDGLGYVGFYFIPHLNSVHFPRSSESAIRELLKDVKEKIYVLDDDSAVSINGPQTEVISEGKSLEIN